MKKKNIILMGFMGTGKTTVSKVLAARTLLKPVDMDEMIVEREEKSINDIFAQDGEAHFRKLERKLCKELSSTHGLIISTGGGVVLNPENITDYERNGLVVCLIASSKEILKRLKNDSSRPLLADNKEDQVVTLLHSRKAMYESIKHCIPTDGYSPEEICDKIIALYESFNSCN